MICPPPAVKRSFECEAFCPDKGVILIGFIAVLKEGQIRPERRVQLSGLFRIPEHVMIAARHHLPPGQLTDVLQIRFALRQIPAPAVVSDKYQRVLRRDQLRAVLPELFFVVFPYPIMHLPRRFQHRLIIAIIRTLLPHPYKSVYSL